MSQVVLITGASSGMGKLTSEFLAQNGYVVYAGSRGTELKQDDGNLKHVYIDVTKTDTVKNAVDTIIKNEGKIDVLVNNAGYGLLATVEDGTDEEMFDQFNVNVFGLLKVTREVLPYMREAKMDSLRFETLPFNVRVHSIQSGLFGTNFVKEGLVANAKTTSEDSPYKELVAHFVPIVAQAINEGPNPQPIADAIKEIIENEEADIFVPVGGEAETFVPLRKELSDKAFEQKVKETFGI